MTDIALLEFAAKEGLKDRLKAGPPWDWATTEEPRIVDDLGFRLLPIPVEGGGHRDGYLLYLAWFICGQAVAGSMEIKSDATPESVAKGVGELAEKLRAYILRKLTAPDPESDNIRIVGDCEVFPPASVVAS